MNDTETASALIHEIGAMIVADENFAAVAWDGIALVAIVGAGSVKVGGFAYVDGEEPQHEAPADMEIHGRFSALCEAMESADGRCWKTALVQIRRSTGAIRFDFEYDDAERWKLTPRNRLSLPRDIEPK